MKLPLKWLKDYIDPLLSSDELVHRLTMAGLEVEAIENVAGDIVLEIEVTPNRPDCLNILGLAREIGAITAKTVRYPKIKTQKNLKNKVSVSIENKKDCTRYIATLITHTQIAKSSQHIQGRLASLGIRSVNNAVDITNFVLMETGQPLHVFDYDKLAGGKIIVRRAKAGETIVTLDGIERKLDPSILVIADAQKPVAIAGVMGGKNSEITSETKNILLESAHFEMGIIRRASRSLGLRSDSSYRFERNVSLEGVLLGAQRATDLLLEATKGQAIARGEVAYKSLVSGLKILLKVSQAKDLLGLEIKATSIKSSLERLGFKVSLKGEALSITPPNHRLDVQQPVDLIEEIARMQGFDRLPMRLPLIKAVNIDVDTRPRRTKKKIREVLTASGLYETVTYTMTNTKALAKSGLSDLKPLRVFNPLTQDQELMRPSLLPSLLQVAMANINRGQKDLRLFEIGKRYFIDGEKSTLAILLTGRRHQDWRANRKEMVEIFDLKGLLERVAQSLNLEIEFKNSDDVLGASIIFQGQCLGSLQKIDVKVLNAWDIKNQDIYFCEMNLEPIMISTVKAIKFQAIPEFPAILRDVSLAVKQDIAYSEIEAICRKEGEGILKSVRFIEQYTGDKIPAGLKGLVFSCQYQSNTKTLREEEVTKIHEGIVQSLLTHCGATRR